LIAARVVGVLSLELADGVAAEKNGCDREDTRYEDERCAQRADDSNVHWGLDFLKGKLEFDTGSIPPEHWADARFHRLRRSIATLRCIEPCIDQAVEERRSHEPQ